MQTLHSAYVGQARNATAVLQVAARFVRVEKQLGMPLRVRAVDVMLGLRLPLIPLAATRMSSLGGNYTISQ
jgi:hypothetical protein